MELRADGWSGVNVPESQKPWTLHPKPKKAPVQISRHFHKPLSFKSVTYGQLTCPERPQAPCGAWAEPSVGKVGRQGRALEMGSKGHMGDQGQGAEVWRSRWLWQLPWGLCHEQP